MAKARMARFAAAVMAMTCSVGMLVSVHGAAAAPARATWVQVADGTDPGCTYTCTGAPPAEAGQEMAYDAATRQIVLFDNGQTWTWNGTAWNERTPATSPPEKNTFGIAYDPESREVIVVGSNDYNDTWAWDGTTWTQVADHGDPGCTTTCTHAPPDTVGNQLAYDTATHQMVLFGGSTGYSATPNDNETWVLQYRNGSYHWRQNDDHGDPGCVTTCTSSPPGRNVAALAYDASSGQLVTFGGEQTGGQANGLNDTWVWHFQPWLQVDHGGSAHRGCGESLPTPDVCPSSPPGRVGTQMAYDPALGGLVLFGGMNDYGNPEYNDTWLWNGTTWAQIADHGDVGCTSACTTSPSARDVFTMAYDAASHQLVVFGGSGDNDTWVLHT